ncbi:MAG TPA: phage baseplate assembly protein [Hanamia sp.]|jgi:phage baseplate assembly protein V|nr:phage baseplate assembly protein [Hanamia sp.]
MFTPDFTQMARRAINRLNNILCRGILTGVKPAKTPTASVTLFNDEKYDGIEFAQDFGFISYPPDDGQTEVLVAFLGGQRDHGTILKAFNKQKALNLPLEKGECAIYNKVTNTYILLKADGTILIKTDADEGVKIEAEKVTITGDLFVNGDIIDNTETNNNTVKDMRDIYNEHVHGGVAPGGAETLATTDTQ